MFYERYKEGYLLRVRLSPNSSSCKIMGVFEAPDGDYLKVAVVSVPEKGKANKELVDFLAKILKLAKSEIDITSGETDRYKKIFINMANDALEERLNEFGKNN